MFLKKYAENNTASDPNHGLNPLDRYRTDDHYGHMVVTNVATLKASLSELLANVKAGEEVVVTERGRPDVDPESHRRLRTAAILEGFHTLPLG